MARGRELRLGREEGKKRGRIAGRLAWLAPQPPRTSASRTRGTPRAGRGGYVGMLAHWLPVGSKGKQGGSSNVPTDPGDCGAVSRRAAALLNFIMVPPCRNSDDALVVVDVEHGGYHLSGVRNFLCGSEFSLRESFYAVSRALSRCVHLRQLLPTPLISPLTVRAVCVGYCY